MRSTKLVPLLALGLLLVAGCRDQVPPLAPDDAALAVAETAGEGPQAMTPDGPAFDFELYEVNIPGVQTRYTQFRKMNAQGDIVGEYQARLEVSPGSFAWLYRGLLLSDGEFHEIHFPGARQTYARGINERGDIVGTYQDASTLKSRGFLLRDGVYTTLHLPGAVGTTATAISADGVIVGQWGDGTKGRAFIWRIGEAEPLRFEVPAATWTAAWGINPQGDVVGCYGDPERNLDYPAGEWGFIRHRDGTITEIELPWPTRLIYAHGITPSGDVVGTHIPVPDGNPLSEGYLLDRHGKLTSFGVPGAYMTYARGISPNGVIVGFGWFYDAGMWTQKGFVAKPLNPAGR
jgi:hypothetical protein